MANLRDNINNIKNKFPEIPGMPELKISNIDVSRPGRHMYKRGSIIHASKENIFEFPVFVSSSISGNMSEVTAVNDLLTQLYASYVQIAVSSQPVVDIKSFRTGKPFKAFKTDINQYLEYCETSYQRDACHASYRLDNKTIMEFEMISIDKSDEQAFCEYALHEPLSEFSHYFQEADNLTDDDRKLERSHTTKNKLNEYGEFDGEDSTYTTPSDAEILRKREEHEWKRQKHREDEKDRETKRKRDEAHEQREINKDKWNENEESRRVAQEKRAKEKHREDERDRRIRRDRDDTHEQREKLKHLWAKNREERDKEKHREDEKDRETKRKRDEAHEQREIEKHNIDKSVKAGKFIDGSKINKLNSLTPMMMTVSMNVEDEKGNLHRQMEYVVGVKTHCRIVDADVLPEVVEFPVKNMDKLTRKAKWRAGEISFWEYLFKTKAKKQTAIDSRDPRRKWYRRLYELAHEKYSTTSAQIKQYSGKRNLIQKMFIEDNYGLMPNATIILSMQDCYNIKDETGIDILDPKVACKFCDDMFLMCLMVMDVDNDNLKILTPDTHNDFDIQSLDSVQKQVAALDPSKARAFNTLLNR